MNVKIILYILITPLVIWALESIDINRFFKKNRVVQATLVYGLLALALTYLVVNFLYDFFEYVRFI